MKEWECVKGKEEGAEPWWWFQSQIQNPELDPALEFSNATGQTQEETTVGTGKEQAENYGKPGKMRYHGSQKRRVVWEEWSHQLF